MSQDLAGRDYWDGIWRRSARRSVGRFSYFHHAFSALLARQLRPGDSICEVGCADSVWVPHLIRRGFQVSGLDYSEPGLARLRRRLESEHLDATLIAGDLFEASPFGGRTFNAIFSLGLVEHFDDPHGAIGAMRDALEPGGVMITMVPNLVGLWGALQLHLDGDVYRRHVPYDRASLDRMHLVMGLEALEPARYFGVCGLLILHRPSWAEAAPRLNRVLSGAQWLGTQAVSWPLGLVLGRHANTRWFSSHVVGVYRRPLGEVGR